MANKVNLRKNERKKYKKLVLIIACVFGLLFGSRLILKPRVSTVATIIGEEVSLDTRKMTLVNIDYSETKDCLSFAFVSPVTSSNVLEQLKVKAKQYRTDEQKYSTKIKRINERLYVASVNGLGDKWKEVTVTVYPSDRKPDNLANDQKFHFTKDFLVEKGFINHALTDKELEHAAQKFELDRVKKEIQKNKKTVKNKKRDIKKIEEVNKELTDSLSTKTDSEKEEIESTINQNLSQITTFENEIADVEKEIIELDQKQKIIENGTK